jgi:8-oxo-dGTP pyrophosphatase MutT (NUDIX family)
MEENTIPAGPSSSIHSYTVAPHLQAEFDVPLSVFAVTHAEYGKFIVGAFIFLCRNGSEEASSASTTTGTATGDNTQTLSSQPLVLLLQRAEYDSYGGYWDFPGGSVENTDATLLDGVVREVFEETGYHVSHIRELVRVDTWGYLTRQFHVGQIAKFSFIVDVHEAVSSESQSAEDGLELDAEPRDDNALTTQQPCEQGEEKHIVNWERIAEEMQALKVEALSISQTTVFDSGKHRREKEGGAEEPIVDWEGRVILAAEEHQNYAWATEADIKTSVHNQDDDTSEEFGPYIFMGVQGSTVLEAFRKYKGLAAVN